MILIVARHWTSQFEWYSHEGQALKAGVTADVIEALRHGRAPAFARDDEQIIYDYATELLEKKSVGEASYQRALDLFGTVGVVELTALLGYYVMVAMTLNAHEIPLPAGATLPLAPLD